METFFKFRTFAGIKQFNNATPENSNDPEEIASSKYDMDEMHNIEIPPKNKPVSYALLLTFSNKNVGDLQYIPWVALKFFLT